MENTPAHFLVRGRIAGKKKTSLVDSVVFGTILPGWFLYVPVKSLIVDDYLWFIDMDEAARGT